MSRVPDLYTHQRITADFLAENLRSFCTSSPGTGKTRSVIKAYEQSRRGKMLVLAPLSILQPSWGDDIDKFSDLSYAIAHGTPEKRQKMMRSNTDIVITNHDAVKWIAKDPTLMDGFAHICVDEFTAFKNGQSQRSKALKQLAFMVEGLWQLSGTPNSNSITDIWFPAFLADKGARLGRSFWNFRSQVCEPVQNGPQINHIQWRDKEGAEFDVADKLKDITVRFRFEDCIDIPEHFVRDMHLPMPKWLEKQYVDFLNSDYLETDDGPVTAIHAGARVRKALQILSGAVYNSDGDPIRVHEDRYKLVIDLILEREATVVAFNYRHERENLTRLADAAGIRYGVIDGSVGNKLRTKYVQEFQAGELDVIFAHPQSAGHGLTLTRGTTTIWCSPTYHGEQYQQFNARIYRAGQTKKTETIRIAYQGSKELDVYEKLDGKLTRMEDLLDLFQEFTKVTA